MAAKANEGDPAQTAPAPEVKVEDSTASTVKNRNVMCKPKAKAKHGINMVEDR